MKETIKYYYNVYPSQVFELNNGCYFYFNDYKFYFVEFNRDLKELELLVKISNDLYNKNILVDTFIFSKDEKYYVLVENVPYVMIRVNSIESDLCSLKDIVYFNNLLKLKNEVRFNNDWALLWINKIDAFEAELSEINTEYPLIQESSSYYVGLAENAVSYYKDTAMEEDMEKIVVNLNHKRVYYNEFSGHINNPLTFTFDYEVRDIAEYIKSSFFDGAIDFDEVVDLILDNNFSRASYRLLFARLIYPSYYFDSVKKIFVLDEDESILEKYVKKNKEYEDFLVDVYNVINRKVPIPPIEWLVNNGKS